ncbi:MAG: hypothetical protein AB1390_08750, partial [Nitrospirota bacterium]
MLWGRNDYGQLGNGTYADSNVPTQIGVNDLIVTAITAGGFHTVALKSDGSVWTWGRNNYGQLGSGTNADSNVPIR